MFDDLDVSGAPISECGLGRNGIELSRYLWYCNYSYMAAASIYGTRGRRDQNWANAGLYHFFFAIILVLCCRLVADGGNISKASSQIRLYDYVTIEAAYSIQELEVNEACRPPC